MSKSDVEGLRLYAAPFFFKPLFCKGRVNKVTVKDLVSHLNYILTSFFLNEIRVGPSLDQNLMLGPSNRPVAPLITMNRD